MSQEEKTPARPGFVQDPLGARESVTTGLRNAQEPEPIESVERSQALTNTPRPEGPEAEIGSSGRFRTNFSFWGPFVLFSRSLCRQNEQRARNSRPGSIAPMAARSLLAGDGRKFLATLALLLSACSDQGLGECRQLIEVEAYQAAMDNCKETFDQTKSSQAGLLAARAARALGRDDEVLDWPQRLAKTSNSTLEIAAAWRLAAGVHEKRGEQELEQQALLESLSHFLRAAAHSEASQVSYTLFYRAWERSDYRSALEMAQATFDHALQASDVEMQGFASEALYAVLYEVGDLEGADRVLNTVEKNLDPADQLGQIHLLLNRGALDFNRQRLALARAGFERGLALAEGLDDLRVLRSLHLNLVEIALEQESLEEAQTHLQAARAHLEVSESPPVRPALLPSAASRGTRQPRRSETSHRRGSESRTRHGLGLAAPAPTGALRSCLGTSRGGGDGTPGSDCYSRETPSGVGSRCPQSVASRATAQAL